MTSCPAQSLRIAFYNVENAFDTLRSPGKDDAEFTPQGEKRWDTRRYRTKIDHLAQVAADLSADLLALAEVENAEVLADITQRVREMTGEGYLGICLESGDRRGIHPALLYRREVFSPTEPAKILPVPHNERGILYVKGAVLASGDTLHLFINHWTSRYMGQKATEGARIAAAQRLAQAVDSISGCSESPRIVLLGDLNDTPDEKSIVRLTTLLPELRRHPPSGAGTYYYRGEWLSFDYIFTNFVPKAALLRLWTKPYLLTPEGMPWRTFSGPIYRADTATTSRYISTGGSEGFLQRTHQHTDRYEIRKTIRHAAHAVGFLRFRAGTVPGFAHDDGCRVERARTGRRGRVEKLPFPG